MTIEMIRPKGFMTLQVLDTQGHVLDQVAHHNQVLGAGRQLLLRLLQGQNAIQEYGLILGIEGFNPDARDVAGQRAAVPVKLSDEVKPELRDNQLVVTFRGTVDKKADVIGGGMLVTSQVGRAKQVDLYNFARTPRTVGLSQGQSVSVNFRLSME